MRFPLDVAALLRGLTVEADNPGGFLADGLDNLLAAGAHAIPSLVAVSLTLVTHGQSITVSAQVAETPVPVRSSLHLRLPGQAGASITLLAAAGQALDQLGADLPALLDIHRDRAVLDKHLTLPTQVALTLGQKLREISTIDRALGVLLDRGMLYAEGVSELERRAARGRMSLADAAGLVLSGISPAT